MNISHCFYKNCHSNFYCCQRLLSCVSKPLNVNRCQPINSFTLTGSQNCKRNVLNINVSFFHCCAFSCLQLHSQCGGGDSDATIRFYFLDSCRYTEAAKVLDVNKCVGAKLKYIYHQHHFYRKCHFS